MRRNHDAIGKWIRIVAVVLGILCVLGACRGEKPLRKTSRGMLGKGVSAECLRAPAYGAGRPELQGFERPLATELRNNYSRSFWFRCGYCFRELSS
jgi:hypothetical protein